MTDIANYINLLKQMLAIPSVSRSEVTRADFLEDWLQKEGLDVERKHNNLLVTSGNKAAEAGLLLNSHIDTVKPGEGWESDPYLPKLEDGKITALGSNDAGASVVSLIATYLALKEKNLTENVVLVLSAEEEISGKKGIESVLKDLPALKFAIVGEPTQMKAAVAERGLAVVDAVAKGKAGHAARDEGINAIYTAMKDIERIQKLEFPKKSLWLKDPSVNVTMINAGTGHNVVPGKCEFVIDIRSNDQYTNIALVDLLKDLLDAELSPRSFRLRSSFLKNTHAVMQLIHDMKLDAFGSPTLSDMALMNFPAVKIGPGDSARSHTANEYILEEEIMHGIELYVKLVEEILKLDL